jgi:hypothetical protein
VCNPFGGLGLTGGIVDVGGLYDCLAGIFEGRADPSILDRYNEVRRQKYNEIINPISSENIVRLFGQDPERALETDEFLKMCKRAETDPETARQMQLGINAVKHDFTQYYRDASKSQDTKVTDTAHVEDLIAPPAQAVAVGGSD